MSLASQISLLATRIAQELKLKATKSTTITATGGLTGGGDLSDNRTIGIDPQFIQQGWTIGGTVGTATVGTPAIRAIGTDANSALAGNTTLSTIASPTTDVSLASHKITNLATPTLTTDAATKGYVDTAIQGLDAKGSVRVATTANITLSGTQTIDGIAVAAGDRILVKDQTTASANGIYVVATGTWARATDADTWAELQSAYVFAEQGTTNADKGFVCTVDTGGTLGTTSVTWVTFTNVAAATYPDITDDGAGHVSINGTITVSGLTSTGTVTIPTATTGDSSTSAASTAFVQTAVTNSAALQVDKYTLSNSADLNTMVTSGNYRGQTITNAPLTGGFWQVFSGSGSSYAVQMFENYAGTQQWIRTNNAGSWSAWKELAGVDSTTFTGTTTASTLNVTGHVRVPQITSPATPPTGEVEVWGDSAFGGLWYKNPDGFSYRLANNDSPALTGTPTAPTPTTGDNTTSVATTAFVQTAISGNQGVLSTEYTNTNPATPTTGITLFTRTRARNLLASVGPQGIDTRYQPAVFSNKIALVTAVNNSTAPTVLGTTITVLNNATATATAVAAASTTFYTGIVKFLVSSTTTAGTAGGIRTPAQWFLSNTANAGGFHFVARFGITSGASGTRGFVGMSSQTAAYAAGTNPSAQLNQIGFYWDAGQTTMRFICSGTTAGTGVDLGANFSTLPSSICFYECSIFVPSGKGQYGMWSATRVADGAYASGTFGTSGGSGAAYAPAIGQLLAAHMNYGNGTAAARYGMGIQSLYIESDN